MSKATLVHYSKESYPDGTILEIRLWQLPKPSSERPHAIKYSLFFGRPGERWVCYDNESGKGDHKHFFDQETPYRFISIDKIFQDFADDIERARKLK